MQFWLHRFSPHTQTRSTRTERKCISTDGRVICKVSTEQANGLCALYRPLLLAAYESVIYSCKCNPVRGLSSSAKTKLAITRAEVESSIINILLTTRLICECNSSADFTMYICVYLRRRLKAYIYEAIIMAPR